jgi:hypothetical protein
VPVTQHEAGTVLGVDAGTQFEPGPAVTGTQAWVAAAQAALRGAGTRWRFPEYFSGDASNGNYASLKESGSPFVAAVEGGQLEWGAFERASAVCVLRMCAESGRLPAGAVARCDVETTAPKVVMTDKGELAQRNQTYHAMGAKSLTEIILEDGRDPKHTFANLAAEKKLGLGSPGGGGQPGGGSPQPSGPGGPDGTPPTPMPTPPAVESLLAEHGPPPRPGLVWNDRTHRWVRPAEQPAPKEEPRVAEPEPEPEPEADPLQAHPDEWAAARKRAAKAIRTAPVPTVEQVEKVRGKLDAWKSACRAAREKGERVPKLREYYDARGGAAAHRKRARRVFEAHGGLEKGYVVCHGTGRKMHWTDDPEQNPHGYPKFEQGKIFVAAQGGDYRDANVLPEHPSYNRLRGNAPLRKENLPVKDARADAGEAVAAFDPTGITVLPEHREQAAKWVEAATDLTPEQRHKYTEDMAHVLSGMTDAGRRLALEAVGRGAVTFLPDTDAVTAAYNGRPAVKQKVSGSGRVGGFVAHRLGDDRAHLTIDGGNDTDPKFKSQSTRQIYAHELGHCIDAGQRYSRDATWASAWKAEIHNPKPANILSLYARTSPTEGFAEFHRHLYERGAAATKAKYPRCYKFWESKGLL